jgi:uncharacterized surface protein with fasciclin (FAS1) repeats
MALKSLIAAGLTCAALVGCSSKSDMKDDMKGGDAKSAMMMAKGDIIDVATGPNMERVTTLVKAIQAADLVGALKGPGPFTVFAPTNEAFAKLPAGTLDDLLKPENKKKLQSILLYHVHSGDAVMAKDVKTMSLSTLNGKPLMVTASGDGVMVNNAKVIKTDVVATNGIIHWVDAVILP